MILTREKALELHRQMWTDMQKELGDNPSPIERFIYKHEWCDKHIGVCEVENDCFLCEYAINVEGNEDKYRPDCSVCPIVWKSETTYFACEHGDVKWMRSPISEILALPERELRND